MDLFSYCDVTTDDGSSNLLKNPKLLPRINNFFDSNNHYLIKTIESGSEHLNSVYTITIPLKTNGGV